MFYKSVFFSAFVLLLFVSPSLQAQDSTSLAGKYALQFQISQNFTLSNFLGSVISGKYHFTNESAIRLGIDFNATMSNESKKTDYNNVNTSENDSYQTNSQTINIITQYIFYPVISDNIKFYYGIGPSIGLGFSKNGTTYNNTGGYFSSRNQTGKSFSAGVQGSAGVEWFFAKKLSLCAEYALSYVYSYSKVEGNPNNDHVEQRNYNYSFTGNNVRFGLSVYF